jgi:hypothetical protein
VAENGSIGLVIPNLGPQDAVLLLQTPAVRAKRRTGGEQGNGENEHAHLPKDQSFEHDVRHHRHAADNGEAAGEDDVFGAGVGVGLFHAAQSKVTGG